ncbi:MAG: branched-chain amino acid transport system ATP-binding protein [Microbacteriaceae bacterium]|nr:branched-chain amino acid transport system ATP-binding protein [Microbacteriaceae bacterium]
MVVQTDPRISHDALDGHAPRLELAGLGAGYGNKKVVFDVSLAVERSKIVALLGHNGAGKTTTMAATVGLAGLKTGRVKIDGRDVSTATARQRVESGLAYVPSDNFVFGDLTVAENLSLGGLTERNAATRKSRQEWIFDRWSILAERSTQLAGTMSGGQRRMLSLGIALMSSPTLLLLDEPSLGLAPNIVDKLFRDLRSLADEDGVAVFIIEQSVAKVLAIADEAYVMRSGHIIAHESARDLAARESLWDLF